MVLAALLLLGFLSPAIANAEEAKVWVNTSSGVYHCPGTQYYGNTQRGKYLAESDALASNYRPAYGRRCSAEARSVASTPAIQTAAAVPGAGTEVWVNSSSGVYHCPGTRYYGATKRGRFMSEADATAAGHRPAYGARCGQ
jgi:hypothetical protein